MGLKGNLDWHKKVQVRACFVVKIWFWHQELRVGDKLSWTNNFQFCKKNKKNRVKIENISQCLGMIN